MNREEKKQRRTLIKELYDSGIITATELSVYFGLSKPYVKQLVIDGHRKEHNRLAAERNKAARSYKAEGHTAKEVAEKFGMSEAHARYICKGISPQSYTKGRQKEESEIAGFVKERAKGFEYVGDYHGADGPCNIRCLKCGTVITRSMASIKQGCVRCPNCWRQERAAVRRAKVLKAEEKRRNRIIRRQAHERQVMIVVCSVCGKLFTTTREDVRTCSPECSKAKVKQSTRYIHGSDGRLNKANIVDRNINLADLYKRDGGVCQICGKQCDYNDCTTTGAGVFIAGNNYPSIDHIIPLSKGGKHSWDNIRLAHRSCNVKEYVQKQKYMPSLS